MSESGKRIRRVYASKTALLTAGAAVVTLTYQRASHDKSGVAKSVDDQERLSVAEVARNGWSLGGSYTDNNISASRHAAPGKVRADFKRLLDDVRAGNADVLVFWELARQQRDLSVYTQVRAMSEEAGVFFWLVGGTLYDLRDRNDRMMLGQLSVQAEFQSDYLRDNIMRGGGFCFKGQAAGSYSVRAPAHIRPGDATVR